MGATRTFFARALTTICRCATPTAAGSRGYQVAHGAERALVPRMAPLSFHAEVLAKCAGRLRAWGLWGKDDDEHELIAAIDEARAADTLLGLLFRSLLGPNRAMGPSMAPTIQTPCFVISAPIDADTVTVGDVVNIKYLTKDGRVRSIIKRVRALAGEPVEVRLVSDAASIQVPVPEGHCWIQGDNEDYSADSRHFGPVPLVNLRMRVTHYFQLFPPKFCRIERMALPASADHLSQNAAPYSGRSSEDSQPASSSPPLFTSPHSPTRVLRPARPKWSRVHGRVRSRSGPKRTRAAGR